MPLILCLQGILLASSFCRFLTVIELLLSLCNHCLSTSENIHVLLVQKAWYLNAIWSFKVLVILNSVTAQAYPLVEACIFLMLSFCCKEHLDYYTTTKNMLLYPR